MNPVDFHPAVEPLITDDAQTKVSALAFVLLIAGLCLAVLTAWVIRRQRGGSGVQAKLIRLTGLTRAQWTFLRRFAARQGVREPLALLVSRGYFDAVTADASPTDAKQLSAMRPLIFR